MTRPLLDVRDLRVSFPIRQAGAMPWASPQQLRAVNGVDFTLEAGRTLGIVGESGCGKSTLARALIGLVPATGRAEWSDGADLIGLSPRRMIAFATFMHSTGGLTQRPESWQDLFFPAIHMRDGS